MKITVTILLILFFRQYSLCQRADTVIVYEHLKPLDRWNLKLKHDGSFELYTVIRYDSKFDLVATGIAKRTDTTIQFLHDTSKLKNKYQVNEKISRYSNIPFILRGDTFPMHNQQLIPHNINYYLPEDSIIMPTGVYAKYTCGEFMWGYSIALNQDGTYLISEHSCVSGFKEDGRWTLDNGMVTLFPKKATSSMHNWFTQDRKLYLTENHLIGKKVTRERPSQKK